LNRAAVQELLDANRPVTKGGILETVQERLRIALEANHGLEILNEATSLTGTGTCPADFEMLNEELKSHLQVPGEFAAGDKKYCGACRSTRNRANSLIHVR